jgi:hypothetical protein
MAAASDFRDVQCQSTHPFSVGDVLEGTEDQETCFGRRLFGGYDQFSYLSKVPIYSR